MRRPAEEATGPERGSGYAGAADGYEGYVDEPEESWDYGGNAGAEGEGDADGDDDAAW